MKRFSLSAFVLLFIGTFLSFGTFAGETLSMDAKPVQPMVLDTATAPEDKAEAAKPLPTDPVSTLETTLKTAQENAASSDVYVPPYPKVISDAAQRGVQIQYLGSVNGFTGWILLDKAGATYVYVSADEQSIFQGMMFDPQGTPITVGQIAEAQARNPSFFGLAEAPKTDSEAAALNDATARAAAALEQAENAPEPKTAGEAMYNSLGVSNFVKLGNPNDTAPILYAFMDPDCPHCHDFLKDVDPTYLATNTIQLRIIPIGLLGEDSKRRAAYTLSQKDGGAQFLAHAKGTKLMPAPAAATLDGQQLNLDLFKLWRFDGTPIFVYKDKSGQIMMVRGAPKDMKKVVGSIAAGTSP